MIIANFDRDDFIIMKETIVIEDGIVAGNFYPKYSTRNPLAKKLISDFLHAVDTLVEIVNPPDIHEVGCGEGYLISRYATSGRKLIASDFSDQIIEIAKDLAIQRSLSIEFKVKSIYSIAPEEDTASLVLCCEVLEHLERPNDALARLAGVTNPYLIASVPREPLWRVLNMARGQYIKNFGNTPGHLQHWSKKKFIKFLESHFEIIQVLNPLPWTLVLAKVKSS